MSFDTVTEISSSSGSACSEWLLSGQNRLSRPIQQSVFRRMTSGEFTEVERSLLMLLYHHRGSWIVAGWTWWLVRLRAAVACCWSVEYLCSCCFDSDDNGNFWLIGAPTTLNCGYCTSPYVINLTNHTFTTKSFNHSLVWTFLTADILSCQRRKAQ